MLLSHTSSFQMSPGTCCATVTTAACLRKHAVAHQHHICPSLNASNTAATELLNLVLISGPRIPPLSQGTSTLFEARASDMCCALSCSLAHLARHASIFTANLHVALAACQRCSRCSVQLAILSCMHVTLLNAFFCKELIPRHDEEEEEFRIKSSEPGTASILYADGQTLCRSHVVQLL